MKTTTLLFLLAQTVLVPIVLCLIRFKDVKYRYRPLFIYLLIKEASELTSFIIIRLSTSSHHPGNAVPYNLMYLGEAICLTTLFYNLGAFKSKKILYYALQIVWILLWTTDMFFIGSLFKFNTVFRVSYCFVLVFIAADLVNKLPVTVRYNMFHNTAFLLCIVFASWFAYNILYEFVDRFSDINDVYSVLSVNVGKFIGLVEAFMYLSCAWAISCIPAKRNIAGIRSGYST